MLEWIARLVAIGGYWGVAALMAIENVVLPLPSELIMPLAGYDASKGHLSLWGVIVAGTIGSVLGSLPLYLPARMLGREKVSAFVERHGKWLLLRKADLDKAHARFEDRGGFLAVFVAQLIPGLRGLISLPAGFMRMNVAVFLLANLAGTAIWCTMLAYAGKLLGPEFMKVDKLLGPTGWIVLGVVLVGGGYWMARRRSKRRKG
jgi:membrane protein DedA with SNARE-associated domain